MGEKIYYWPGDESNVHERMRAVAVSQHIKDFDRSCKAKIYYPKDDEEEAKEFWEVIFILEVLVWQITISLFVIIAHFSCFC
jgi:hypothetical protein